MKVAMESAQISMAAYGLTDIGRRRATNEDALLLTDFTQENYGAAPMTLAQIGAHGVLLAVADGMGGAQAGEVASALALSLLRRELQCGTTASSEELRQVAEYVNAALWQYAQQQPQTKGMGTTLTAALVRDGLVHLAQVGDSRAYLLRGQHIQQLTRDQSLVQRLLDEGWLTAAEAAQHPYRNVILQALGVRPKLEVVLTTVALERHDYLLLCSDGLSNKLSAAELQQLVQEADSPAQACQLLIEMANLRGGEDNITVIVAQFAGADLYTGSKATLHSGASYCAGAARQFVAV